MPLVQIDLQGHHYRGEPYSFRVEILDHALDHLIEDARNAYRVYELFAIRRPGDLWKYLWVRLIDVPGSNKGCASITSGLTRLCPYLILIGCFPGVVIPPRSMNAG